MKTTTRASSPAQDQATGISCDVYSSMEQPARSLLESEQHLPPGSPRQPILKRENLGSNNNTLHMKYPVSDDKPRRKLVDLMR